MRKYDSVKRNVHSSFYLTLISVVSTVPGVGQRQRSSRDYYSTEEAMTTVGDPQCYGGT